MAIGGIFLEAHWWWMIAAVLLAVAEILVPGFFLIWLAVAAMLSGFLTMVFGVPLAAQFGLFAIFALAAIYAARRWLRRNPILSSDPMLNDRVARLIGERVTVVDAIVNGHGRVAVGDGAWPARGVDAPAGSFVRIVGVDGGTLLVEP
ncbi:MAG: hypothetical protein JWM75_2867 [Sphingomonas bacterium]|nr:hypothetical protein [Sphingomonas bacterium]